MLTTKINKAMDKMVKCYYEFMKAAKELEDISGIATQNHNTILSNECMADKREELVKRMNNASNDALGK